MTNDVVNTYKEFLGKISDIGKALENNAQLFDSKVITKDEFEAKKSNIYNNEKIQVFNCNITDKKINNIIDSKNIEYVYNQALKLYSKAESVDDYDFIINQLKLIIGYKDSNKIYNDCVENQQGLIKECTYKEAKENINSDKIDLLIISRDKLLSLGSYLDSEKLAKKCDDKITKIEDKINAKNKKKEIEKQKDEKIRKKKMIVTIVVMVVIMVVLAVIATIVPLIKNPVKEERQNNIKKLINEGKYEEAQNLIDKNGIYGDVIELRSMCKAGEAFDNLDYKKGVQEICSIGGSVTINYDSNGFAVNKESDEINEASGLDTLSLINIGRGYKWEMSNYFLDANLYNASLTFKYVKLDKVYLYVDDSENSIYFGSYPQTKISNSTLISALNAKAGTLPISENTYNWIDYGYYTEGNIKSYMYYNDIDNDNDGTYDYRGVYFTEYRSYYTSKSNSKDNSNQDNSGYYTNNIYWFKYEPIKWSILKYSFNNVLITSDLVIDAQDYNNTRITRNGATDYQGNKTADTVYPNNYKFSHIRSWLNEVFYETAFNTLEKEIIETTTVDNNASSTGYDSNIYVCDSTRDKIFLLSYVEAKACYSSDSARLAKGSDYAKSQGLYVSNSSPYKDNVYYWLRSPCYSDDYNEYCARAVEYDGNVDGEYCYGVGNTNSGVRPVCWINLIK